jgi:hypothetical protein
MKAETPSQQSVALLWLGLALTFILSFAFYQSVVPNDYWWYVRLGEEIVTSRAIPQVDSYSYSQAGQPMVYHSWLAAVIFWLTYQTGGLTLTVLLRGGLLAFFYTFVWQTCRAAGAGPRLASLIILLTALATSNNWVIRPQLFSYPLFGLTLWLLWRWQQGRPGWLWALPVIMLLWVNLHGAFILGFLLVGAALIFGRGDRRALLWALLAMGLVSFMTPRLWGSWAYVFALVTDPSSQQFSVEWRPPTSADLPGKLFFGWLLLLPPLVYLSPRRVHWLHWVWLLGFGWMAVSGVRYVIWFLAILAPFTAHLAVPLVGRYLDRPVKEVKPAFNGLITALFLLLSLLFLPAPRQLLLGELAPPPLSANTPVEATDWLAANAAHLPGPLWADLNFASYQIFALPEYPVWIDTRFELYPPEQWERHIRLATAAPDWRDILNEEGINLLLLDPANQPRLAQALAAVDGWALCYEDEVARLYVRVDDGRLPAVCPTLAH